MNIVFVIPGPLRSMTGGRSHVDVETSGGTLHDALEGLFAVYPGIRDRVLTERGEIRQHVNIFVGNEETRTTGGLATPLASGMEISIIPAISGGGWLGSTTRACRCHLGLGSWETPSDDAPRHGCRGMADLR
jgi:molybdopterin converting factor small subunit